MPPRWGFLLILEPLQAVRHADVFQLVLSVELVLEIFVEEFHAGVRFQGEFALLFSSLQKFVGGAVGLQADEDADFLNPLQRRVELVKAADEKISDEAIEKARVVTEQHGKAVA